METSTTGNEALPSLFVAGIQTTWGRFSSLSDKALLLHKMGVLPKDLDILLGSSIEEVGIIILG